MSGNVFLKGARPSTHEEDPLVRSDFDPRIKVVEQRDSVDLSIVVDRSWGNVSKRRLVTTELLGRAKIPNLPYLQPDGRPCRIDTDYFGNTRDVNHPFPGPFALPKDGELVLRVWPVQ
jgi:alpha-N-arabinofuranosidase